MLEIIMFGTTYGTHCLIELKRKYRISKKVGKHIPIRLPKLHIDGFAPVVVRQTQSEIIYQILLGLRNSQIFQYPPNFFCPMLPLFFQHSRIHATAQGQQLLRCAAQHRG